MDAVQDARDFLKDNGQDGTLRALDAALDILRASHHELTKALEEAFEELCNPTLQSDKWRDFVTNISEIISRAQLLQISASDKHQLIAERLERSKLEALSIE
jgi:hypothetical protein